MRDLSRVPAPLVGLVAGFLAWMLVACAPLIGPYSPVAYQNATSLKAETLALMDQATEPYAAHEASVEALRLEIDKAYEYVQGVPSNGVSARQWDTLRKTDGALLGRFFSRWEEEGVLGAAFVAEFKAVVSDAFDEIICLEANKKEATRCQPG